MRASSMQADEATGQTTKPGRYACEKSALVTCQTRAGEAPRILEPSTDSFDEQSGVDRTRDEPGYAETTPRAVNSSAISAAHSSNDFSADLTTRSGSAGGS